MDGLPLPGFLSKFCPDFLAALLVSFGVLVEPIDGLAKFLDFLPALATTRTFSRALSATNNFFKNEARHDRTARF